MTKNRTPTPVYLDPGMHPGLEVKGLILSSVFRYRLLVTAAASIKLITWIKPPVNTQLDLTNPLSATGATANIQCSIYIIPLQQYVPFVNFDNLNR